MKIWVNVIAIGNNFLRFTAFKTRKVLISCFGSVPVLGKIFNSVLRVNASTFSVCTNKCTKPNLPGPLKDFSPLNSER